VRGGLKQNKTTRLITQATCKFIYLQCTLHGYLTAICEVQIYYWCGGVIKV
jgi:hypothetical protein